MGWLVKEKRGISWKDQALDSIAAPPLPLMVFFGLFIMLLWLTTYSDYKQRVERGKMGLRFGLLLMPLVGFLVVNMMMLRRRWWRCTFGTSRHDEGAEEGSGSPLGLLIVLVVLLIMVYHQSSFQSAWFRRF